MTDYIEVTGQVAQGDILITPCGAIPGGYSKAKANNIDHVIAHSETGHHHVMAEDTVEFFQAANDPFVSYLHVTAPTELRHLRGFDTHKTYLFPPGNYRVNRQGEETIDGWARVED